MIDTDKYEGHTEGPWEFKHINSNWYQCGDAFVKYTTISYFDSDDSASIWILAIVRLAGSPLVNLAQP